MGSLCDRSQGTTLTVRKFTRLTVQKVERQSRGQVFDRARAECIMTVQILVRPILPAWCEHHNFLKFCTANLTSAVNTTIFVYIFLRLRCGCMFAW